MQILFYARFTLTFVKTKIVMTFINLSTGPSYIPKDVRSVLSQNIVSHRSNQFKNTFKSIKRKLKEITQSDFEPVFLTCSGTGAIDAIVSSLIKKESKVLVLSCGYYGDLISFILDSRLSHHDRIRFQNGEIINIDHLKQILSKKSFDFILFTHNESSTGTTNPINEVVKTIKKYSNAFIIVDAISSFGGISINLKLLEIDAIICSTQKALMSPPGLSFILMNDRFISEVINHGADTQYYFNLKKYLLESLKNQVPFTPAITTFFALDKSLELILHEGVSNVYYRHEAVAQLCRDIFTKLEWNFVTKDKINLSNTITAVKLPKYIKNSQTLLDRLEQNHNMIISKGNGSWTESIIRIGHMGYVNEKIILKFKNVINEIDVSQKIGRYV